MKKIALILFLSLRFNISFAVDNETPDFQTTKVFVEQGVTYAQFNLGVMYENKEGLKQDKAEAKRWYRKACDNKSEAGCEAFKELNEGAY